MSHEEHELHRIEEMLEAMWKDIKQILINTTPRRSARLTYKGKSMFTILVGKTASPVFQEWSGPNGTGDKLPPVGNVTYVSSDPSKISVDPNSGIATGVAITDPTAPVTITATDSGNSLSATAQGNVTEVAVSATLDFTPNP
jgi:hypothetical protein